MADSHSYLGPLDGYDPRIQWHDVFSRLNDRLVRWVFGAGFLFFHLAVFGSALLASYCWNLIAQPSDLQVVEPFRYWGIAAIVHTVLTGGGLLGWRLFQMGRPENSAIQIPATIGTVASSPLAQNRGQAWQSALTRGHESVQRVNATARKWAGAPQKRSAPWAARDVKEGWPEQPQAFRSATEIDRLEASLPDVGEATWPDSAPLSTMLTANGESRLDSDTDHVVSVDHRSASSSENSSQTWIEGFIASRARDKENRWSWVEAAASSWLSRKEPSGPTELESGLPGGEFNLTSPVPDSEEEGTDDPPV